MNIFEDTGANGHAAAVDVIDLAPAHMPPAAKAEGPVDGAHARAVRSIVADMRESWTAGRMQGEALEQWVRIYSALLTNVTSAPEVMRAAELADVAYHVMQRRSQAK